VKRIRWRGDPFEPEFNKSVQEWLIDMGYLAFVLVFFVPLGSEVLEGVDTKPRWWPVVFPSVSGYVFGVIRLSNIENALRLRPYLFSENIERLRF
jgi:hypothetical protein